MEESIHNLIVMVRTIFAVPLTIFLVFMVIAVPALGLKKILGDVIQEMKDEKRQRARDRLYRKTVLDDDNDSIREWIWGHHHN